jgi:hydroxymethylbilane synthase
MKIRCGTRGSLLALAQTQMVIDALHQKHPHIQIERLEVKTIGDRKQDTPAASHTDKKDWIYDLELALLDNTIDFAVHSSKDIPYVIEPGTALLPVLKRGNPRDSFVGQLLSPSGERLKFADLPQGAKVGTSSLRRKAYLLRLRPDLDVVEYRGNVPTRLQKMDSKGDVMGIILATTGLERLNFTDLQYETFSIDEMTPALNQATLAVQFRENDDAVKTLLEAVVDAPTYATWRAERTIAEILKGDCKTAMAVFAECKGDTLSLTATVMLPDGTNAVHADASALTSEPEKLGEKVGMRLLELGAQAIIDQSRNV